MSLEHFDHPSQKDAPVKQSIKSPEELEKKFGRASQLIGSAVLAGAALMGGVQEAHAGGAMPVSLEHPTISALNKKIQANGVDIKSVMNGMWGLTVQTTKGEIRLTPPPQGYQLSASQLATVLLENVTPKQFVDEVERQQGGPVFLDKVKGEGGETTIEIPSYVEVMLKQNNVVYKNGILSKGGVTHNLTGTPDQPNTDCSLSNMGEFKDDIQAECKRVEIKNGRPIFGTFKYQINTKDLSIK